MNATFLVFLLAFLAPVLAQDPCLQRPDPGLCNVHSERYFYNPFTQSCESFLWGGCDGVVPFVTLEDCQIAQCNVPKCRQLPHPGICRAYITRYFYNRTSGMCQQFIWGGCRGNVPFETFQQCQNDCSVDRCRLNPDPGPCRAFFPKYFYNETSMFIYGGCRGVVPFDTLRQCVNSCGDRCVRKPRPGPCRGLFYRYFFNHTSEGCERFIWGGCRGRVPFDTFEECENAECMVGASSPPVFPDVILQDDPSAMIINEADE